MKRVVVAVGLALMMGGCAAQRQPAPPPVKVALAPEPKPETPAPPPGAGILAAQPSQVRDAVKQHERSGKWPVYRTPAFVLYPYGEGAAPIVDCAPLRTTDIQLEPGETVTDLASGDQERWMAAPASSGDPRKPGECRKFRVCEPYKEARQGGGKTVWRRTRKSGLRTRCWTSFWMDAIRRRYSRPAA
jgi:hypothetical protein